MEIKTNNIVNKSQRFDCQRSEVQLSKTTRVHGPGTRKPKLIYA